MSSFRNVTKLLRNSSATIKNFQRGFQSSSTHTKQFRPLIIGGLALGSTYGAYHIYKNHVFSLEGLKSLPFTVHAAANYPESQPSVFSQGKNHAVYLTIHLKPSANVKECAKAMSRLQNYVDEVCPKDLRDEEDEIWAGVGFGPNFYSQVAGKTKKNFVYPHRKGALGDMPSTGGDIFIHAKCNTYSKLFELSQRILAALPQGSVDSFEDVYSFVYKNGRDLSGFIDGTENPADDELRQTVAVERETGGSYVITQKWIHKMDVIATEKDAVMEGWVGRTRSDSTELQKKAPTSHVARMTGGTNFEQETKFEIVRQSMPFGTLNDKCGLFFIAYAASTENFEFMLDRMVGADRDGLSDNIMKLSDCVAGTYWYFPGVAELKKLA